MHAASRREPWVDALRVLAVLGVFIVNGLGYLFSPAYPLQIGPPQPIDSGWALAVHGLVIAFVMGKGWPLLSFLLGYSLCSIALAARARGLNPAITLRRRYWKLLLVGVMHGVVLYFGDILTIYALCGLLMAGWALVRPRRLLVLLNRAAWVAVVISFIYCLSAVDTLFAASMSANLSANTVLERFGNVITVQQFWALNMVSFGWQQLNSLIGFAPYVLWAAMAGVLARRFQLLGQHRIARQFWDNHLKAANGWLALICNLALAGASVHLHASKGYSEQASAIATLSAMAGIWLAACALAWAMRRIHRLNRVPAWALWLAPAGRHTLGMYVGLSAGLMLTNSAFLNLTGSTIATFAALIGAWGLAVVVGITFSAKGWRGPIAHWLSK